MRRALALWLVGACGSAAPALYPAGTNEDDGHGELAQASSKLLIAGPRDDTRPERADPPGEPYGGLAYGAFVVPSWQYQAAHRAPSYTPVTGLTGAIEGTITWRGAVPPKRETPCGPRDVVTIGEGRGVADVLVYIERVRAGRALPFDNRPASVGGVVVKRGCALVPAVQIVTPLPAALAIHGDGAPAHLALAPPDGTSRRIELEPAGRFALQVAPGITRVEASDGSLAPAWVVALDTPYYAITDDRGRFRIDELAPGRYEVTVWQAPVRDGRAPIVVKRTVRVDPRRPARLDVALSDR